MRKEDLESPDAKTFEVVQKEVSDLMNGRVLVGHALSNDLNVLFLSHPKVDTRDTFEWVLSFVLGEFFCEISLDV